MGPGDGIQIQRLMDLPTTLETADTVSNPIISSPLQAQQPNPPPGSVRVKSMIQQSPGGKLPSRLPSAHPAHPQRSISHNEVSFCFFVKLLHEVKFSLSENATKRVSLLGNEEPDFGGDSQFFLFFSFGPPYEMKKIKVV